MYIANDRVKICETVDWLVKTFCNLSTFEKQEFHCAFIRRLADGVHSSVCSYLPGFVLLKEKVEHWIECVIDAVDDHINSSLFKFRLTGKTCVIITFIFLLLARYVPNVAKRSI